MPGCGHTLACPPRADCVCETACPVGGEPDGCQMRRTRLRSADEREWQPYGHDSERTHTVHQDRQPPSVPLRQSHNQTVIRSIHVYVSESPPVRWANSGMSAPCLLKMPVPAVRGTSCERVDADCWVAEDCRRFFPNRGETPHSGSRSRARTGWHNENGSLPLGTKPLVIAVVRVKGVEPSRGCPHMDLNCPKHTQNEGSKYKYNASEWCPKGVANAAC